MRTYLTLSLLTISVWLFGQTNKELEYIKVRDKYINYFQKIDHNKTSYALTDKRDNDNLLVLEKMLLEILKDSHIANISKLGKINLGTLQQDMGFGSLDGIVINMNNKNVHAPQILVTSKTLFFEYFKNKQIKSFEGLTIKQLDNIFTSSFGGGEARVETYSIVKKTITKSTYIYGCIGGLGQEGDLPPNCALILALNKDYVYVILEYYDTSIKELSKCKSVSDSLYALSGYYSKKYDASNPKDKTLINKSSDYLTKAYDQYVECYQRNLKEKAVLEKIKNKVVSVIKYAEK